MARETIENRIKKAVDDHNERMKKLGVELRDEIVAGLRELLPEGWLLRWSHSDQCYNDEDYYWDIQSAYLISEREPRQGKEINAANPGRKETRASPSYGYGSTPQSYEVTVGASEAEYEWELDDKCKKRKAGDIDELYVGEPGVIGVGRDEADRGLGMYCGLTKKAAAPIIKAFRALDRNALELAFGSSATVTITADDDKVGTYRN